MYGKPTLRFTPHGGRGCAPRIVRTIGAPALLCILTGTAWSAAQAQDAPAASVRVASAAATDGQAQDAPTPAASVRPVEFAAGVSASEAYTSNSAGTSIGANDDFISTIGFNAAIHDRGRRVALDATYSFGASFYAKGTQSTQITNNLSAVGSIEAIEDHLIVTAKAFAAPVIVSNVSSVTAGNRSVPNGYRNSYGYELSPDLKFRFGQFATSDTVATYASSFFTNPAGPAPVIIPGLAGPEDTNTRTLSQTIASGEEFGRISWTLGGIFSETKRKQGLLSEKAGTAELRYAFSHEFSLLATVGYEGITATVPLSRNLSGLIAMGGFSWTWGPDFLLTVQAGRKFNSASYLGNFRYNITPTTSIVASANDEVTTPEGQLLDSLTNLVATPNGSLTTTADLLGNGNPASIPTFNPQSPGSFGFDQTIARYQTVGLGFLEDFERNHAAVNLFGSRRTFISGILTGPPITESWGGQVTYARDISPRTSGSLGGGYFEDQELGGQARSFRVNAQVSYAMSREMQVYMRADYLDRRSSAALSAVSPTFTGSLSDYDILIGISRTL